MNTPTPEKSVEEIMRECDVLFDGIELAKGWFRKTLQAERTKRDEMVEAERERICKDLDEMWSALYGAYLNNQDLRDLIKGVVTKPNNRLKEVADDWKKQALDLSETHDVEITHPNNSN